MSVHSPRKRLALSIILPVLNVWLRLFHRARPVHGTTPLRRILVFRPDHIGDAIMATAVLKPLRAKYPEAHIAMCVGPWAAGLFAGHPGIDELIEAELSWWGGVRKRITNRGAGLGVVGLVRRLRRERFDLFLDVRSDVRHILIGVLGGARHTIAYNRTGADAALSGTVPYHYREHEVTKAVRLLEPLGIKVAEPELWLPVREEARETLAGKLGGAGVAADAVVIVLCPQTRVRVKEWPERHWVDLMRGLVNKPDGGPDGLRIVVVGDKVAGVSGAGGAGEPGKDFCGDADADRAGGAV